MKPRHLAPRHLTLPLALALLHLWGCGTHSPADAVLDAGGAGTVPGTWVAVAAGTFYMGSPPTEPCREKSYKETRHKVTLTRRFELLTTEVTQRDFEAVMGYNNASFKACGSCPMETVSWNEAAAYCNALSRLKGLLPCYDCSGTSSSVTCKVASAFQGKSSSCPGYRLPSEAEWEYAYRSGTTSAFYVGPIGSCSNDPNAGTIGWYAGNTSGTTHLTGQRKPSAWGLYDMAGNVQEWVNDWMQPDLGASPATDPSGPASGSLRGVRGGAAYSQASALRAASRDGTPAHQSGQGTGFRVVRTL